MVREWLRSLHDKGEPEYGEPDEWHFDFPWDEVQIGFWLWVMSDFKHLPTQQEVQQYDPRWISDMKLAYKIYSHQGNNSAAMNRVEQWMQQHDQRKGHNNELFDNSLEGVNDEGLDNDLDNDDGVIMKPSFKPRPRGRR